MKNYRDRMRNYKILVGQSFLLPLLFFLLMHNFSSFFSDGKTLSYKLSQPQFV